MCARSDRSWPLCLENLTIKGWKAQLGLCLLCPAPLLALTQFRRVDYTWSSARGPPASCPLSWRARATHGALQRSSRVRGKVWQCVSGDRLGTFVGTIGQPARSSGPVKHLIPDVIMLLRLWSEYNPNETTELFWIQWQVSYVIGQRQQRLSLIDFC